VATGEVLEGTLQGHQLRGLPAAEMAACDDGGGCGGDDDDDDGDDDDDDDDDDDVVAGSGVKTWTWASS